MNITRACTLESPNSSSYRYILTFEDGGQYAADCSPLNNLGLRNELDTLVESGRSVTLDMYLNNEPHNPAFYDGLDHMHIIRIEKAQIAA